ncbi:MULTISPECIES: class I SAM-dependent methyltransferase [Bacillus]|uniref:class I SAM-dependent methyltransferase n=1 Tax=Bacillus TaxID=1386 RepID=UPI000BB96F81|nr:MULTISPECIES: class I SAM-dependent methyltransferase [Bacillus]
MSDSYKDSLLEAYNNKASERNTTEVEGWKAIERNEFLAKLNKKGKLLEIGAGPGHDGKFFLEQGLEVTCIDLSPEMVQKCTEKGLNAKVMSFDEMSFEDNSFDYVWALNCLLHVPKNELDKVLKEIKRVLKPGGLLYYGVYGGKNSEGVWENDFYEPKRFFSFFGNEEIVEFVGEYFELVSFKGIPKEVIGNSDLNFQSMVWKKKY